jgi:hypothetical protein
MSNSTLIPVIFPNFNTSGLAPVGHAGFILVDNSGNATYYDYGSYGNGTPAS